jgi:hypothetical protein
MAGEKEYEVPAYVPHLSYGGLMEPSEDFKVAGGLLYRKFNELHGLGFKFKKEFVKKTIQAIGYSINLPSDVIQAFIKQTMYIRIKRKNQILDDMKRLKLQKRKNKANENLNKNSAKAKKYKKITT